MHLDISCKNIMFENSNCDKIVILDFGISKIYKN